MVSALALVGALALTLAQAAPPGMDPEMLELAAMLRQSCVEESGVQEALLGAVDAGGALPTDAAFKCYLKCTMESAGMMSEGTVDVDAVLALLPDALRRRLEAPLRSCGTQPGAEPCEVAFNTQACWRAAKQDDYFII